MANEKAKRAEEAKRVLAANLSYQMKRKGISRYKLSDETGISYTTISDWLRGNTYPRPSALNTLAEYLGVHTSDLVDGTHESMPENNGVVSIPIVGSHPANDILSESNIYGYEKRVRAGLPQNEMVLIRQDNDVMEGIIPMGATVLVEQLPSYEGYKDGDIVLFRTDDGFELRKLQRTDKNMLLLPGNPKYEARVYARQHEQKIKGRAIQYDVKLR